MQLVGKRRRVRLGWQRPNTRDEKVYGKDGNRAGGKTVSHPPVYYRVRSCVRFVFWVSLIGTTLILIGSIGDEKQGLPDCEYYHYPCETSTTVYDPYGYNIYSYNG